MPARELAAVLIVLTLAGCAVSGNGGTDTDRSSPPEAVAPSVNAEAPASTPTTISVNSVNTTTTIPSTPEGAACTSFDEDNYEHYEPEEVRDLYDSFLLKAKPVLDELQPDARGDGIDTLIDGIYGLDEAVAKARSDNEASLFTAFSTSGNRCLTYLSAANGHCNFRAVLYRQAVEDVGGFLSPEALKDVEKFINECGGKYRAAFSAFADCHSYFTIPASGYSSALLSGYEQCLVHILAADLGVTDLSDRSGARFAGATAGTGGVETSTATGGGGTNTAAGTSTAEAPTTAAGAGEVRAAAGGGGTSTASGGGGTSTAAGEGAAITADTAADRAATTTTTGRVVVVTTTTLAASASTNPPTTTAETSTTLPPPATSAPTTTLPPPTPTTTAAEVGEQPTYPVCEVVTEAFNHYIGKDKATNGAVVIRVADALNRLMVMERPMPAPESGGEIRDAARRIQNKVVTLNDLDGESQVLVSVYEDLSGGGDAVTFGKMHGEADYWTFYALLNSPGADRCRNYIDESRRHCVVYEWYYRKAADGWTPAPGSIEWLRGFYDECVKMHDDGLRGFADCYRSSSLYACGRP